MGIFDRIKKFFTDDKVGTEGVTTSNTENNINRSFNPVVKKGGTSEQNFENSFNTFNGPVMIIDGSVLPVNHPLIKARKSEIKTLMDSVSTSDALSAYMKLQTDLVGEALSVDDKFYILNGIYNCKVNLNTDEVELDSIKNKIELLSDASDYHKFLYLTAIRYFNKQDFQNAIRLCDGAISYNEDYDKSKLLKVLAQGIEQTINYDTALAELDRFKDKYKDDTRELSNVVCAKADLAYMLKRLDDAVVFYTEANSIHNSLHYQLGIGMSYFYLATKDTTDKGYITFDKVDFDKLLESVKIFESILEQMKSKKDILTLTRMIPYYLNALEMIDEPQKVIDLTMKTEYIEGLETEQVTRMKAYAEMKLGKNPADLSEGLNETEKLKLEVTWLMFKGKFDIVVEKVSSLMDSIFKGDEQILAFYLLALSKTDIEKFTEMFAKYSKGSESEVKFKLIWIQHLEHNDGVEEAKERLDELLKDSPNKLVVNDAYRFYKRHGYDKEAFEITSAVVKNKFSVLRGDLPEFIKTHFFTLLENMDYEELDRFYGQIDFKVLTDKTRLQIEIEYLVTKGEVFNIAEKCMEYAELANDNNVALKGAFFFIKGGNVDKGIELLHELIDVKNVKTSDVYIQLAQAYVLKEDYDKAYEMAYQAKEVDKDHYKSESHRFFVSLSLRVNRVDDSVKYMGEFHEEFPKNKWIKPVTIIKNDDEGNEVVDTDAIDSLLGDREVYNYLRESFFSYEIGLSTYMKVLRETKIDLIFAETRYKKRKIKIASGFVKQVNEDAELVSDKILVDTLSLYVLSETDILEVLESFEKVYVLYSTIESIQNSLIMNECEVLRSILHYIHSESNVEIVPISSSLIIKDERFLEETGHCIGYSKTNNLPYLCVDFNLKSVLTDESQYVIDISALLRGLSLRDFEHRSKYSMYNNKLLKAGFSSISFNAFDIYDSIISLESFDTLETELDVYLSMNRYCDYESYIKVYNHFLLLIEQNVEREVYIRCVVAIFKHLNRYLGKTQYYYRKLILIANSHVIKEPFFQSRNIVNEFLNYSNHVEERLDIDFYKALSQNINYRKLDGIITSIINGLFMFFGRYKADPGEFEFLCELMKLHIPNVNNVVVDILISEMEKANEETA